MLKRESGTYSGLLIGRNTPRIWSLPKGHIDAGEDELSAARREIYEESGIKNLEFVTKLGNYKRHRIGLKGGEDDSETKHITFFLFRTDETRLKPVDPENPEARWVKKEKVAELLTHPKDKSFFLDILETLKMEESS